MTNGRLNKEKWFCCFFFKSSIPFVSTYKKKQSFSFGLIGNELFIIGNKKKIYVHWENGVGEWRFDNKTKIWKRRRRMTIFFFFFFLASVR